MKQLKLIAGQQNIILTKCPTGYAQGANKPKRIKPAKLFNPVIVLRKLEYEAA